jgi:transcriptional regulator with XRE-family HTH domain
MSQTDLCDASGVSQSVVSKVENGRPDNNRVRATTLGRLSTALGRPADFLETMASGETIEAVEGRSDAASTTAVVEAIESDPGLSEESRRFLIGMYERERDRSRA